MTNPRSRQRLAGPKFRPIERKSAKTASPSKPLSFHEDSKRGNAPCSQQQSDGKPLDLVTPPADHRFKSGRY